MQCAAGAGAGAVLSQRYRGTPCGLMICGEGCFEKSDLETFCGSVQGELCTMNEYTRHTPVAQLTINFAVERTVLLMEGFEPTFCVLETFLAGRWRWRMNNGLPSFSFLDPFAF